MSSLLMQLSKATSSAFNNIGPNLKTCTGRGHTLNLTPPSPWQQTVQIRTHVGFTNWQMYKDYNRRKCVKKHFAERMRLNAIRKNTILPHELQSIAHADVIALPRDSNPIRLRNRCVMTSRPRGLRRKWRVSRIMFRHFVDYNQLSGYTRACW